MQISTFPPIPSYSSINSTAQTPSSLSVTVLPLVAQKTSLPLTRGLEISAPDAALAGVCLAKTKKKKSTSVKNLEPLINPTAFAKETVESVISVWQNPEYIQPGQTPMETPSPETIGKSIQLVESEMNRFNQDYQDYSRIQTVDAETQRTLVEAGLCSPEEAATFLNANSNASWSSPASSAKEIRSHFIETMGYTPNDLQLRKSLHCLIGFFVRELFELKRDDNIGAVILNNNEHPVVLFRGSTMVGVEEQNSTFRNLIEKANVTNVVNLYAESYPLHDLIDKEPEVCGEYGTRVSHHDERKETPLRQWREIIQNKKQYTENKGKAEDLVSQVIKDIMIPGGKSLEGNVFVHCGGGMHRTGMIVGIIRRYFNNDSISDIKSDYQRHIAWKSEEDPGGYEELNIKFIEEFDLSVLDRVLKGETSTALDKAAAYELSLKLLRYL